MVVRNNIAAGLVLATFGIGMAGSEAAAVTLTFNGLDVSPAAKVDIAATAEGKSFNNLQAGGFSMSDGTDDFVAWCIDLFDTIKNSAEYIVTTPPQVTVAEEADLNRLFTQHRTNAQIDAISAAAFQLAIWEIVYETEASYSIAAGNFSASDNAAVTTAAQGLLDTLGTTQAYTLTFYESSTSQDLVTGELAPVPLPAGVILMLSSLGILGAARRRRA